MGGQSEGKDRIRTEASAEEDVGADTDEDLLFREENKALTKKMGGLLP